MFLYGHEDEKYSYVPYVEALELAYNRRDLVRDLVVHTT